MSNSRPAVDRFDHLFLATAKFDALLAFYNEVLGWAVVTQWGSKKEGRGVVLSGGGIKLVLAEKHAGDPGPHPQVYLDIHDVDTRFRMIPKGDHVVAKPEDTHWGTRRFVVRDPDGNLIAFEERKRGG